MRTKLTPAKIARAKPPPMRNSLEMWDTEVPGLFVVVLRSGVKSFYIYWRRGRRKVIGRFGLHTLEQVRLKARKLLIEAKEHGEPRSITRAVTLGEFYRDHYKPHAEANHKDAKGTLKAIQTEFGEHFNRRLSDITPWLMERYRQKKLKAGVSQATINRHFDRIRSVLAKAVEWKHLAEHPLRGLKRARIDSRGVVRWLSLKEEEALRAALAARDAKMRAERESANRWRAERDYELYPAIPADGFGDHLTPMALVSLQTGMRRGECRKITWADVDLERAVLTIRGGYAKSGQTRHIPLNSEALDVLRRWKRQGAGERVFPVLRVDKSWSAVLAAAKVTGFRWHDLRHSFASKLVMAGVDLNTVRELLGHADIAMTLRYAHLAAEHKAEAVARLVAKAAA